MGVFTKSPIEKARKEAARAYLRYNDIADSRQYSCGMALSAMITPELSIEARKFNAAMKTLKEIDPACPNYTELPT